MDATPSMAFAPTFLGGRPCTLAERGQSFQPSAVKASFNSVALARGKGKGRGRTVEEPQPPSSLWSIAAGIAIGGGQAIRAALCQRSAFGKGGGKGYRGGPGGRGGGGNLSPGEVQRLTEAKRKREADQFFQYQRRLVSTGVQPRDDRFWDREESRLFKTAHVSKGINFDKYESIEVTTEGGTGKEIPIKSFPDACDRYSLPDDLTDNINRCGYDAPTPVQKYSVPAVLEGSDVMVTAQTGSGKTAAFLVPIITAALKAGPKPVKEGAVCPTGVVLSPTRELCQQITEEAKRLVFRSPARVASIFGGSDAIPQLRDIAGGIEIVVCTPGRLEDFLQRGVISMEEVKFLALDEADRMLDMGFEPQIRTIIEDYGMPQPGDRQTMMFSATFPREMQDMALDFLDPAYFSISVGKVGATTSNVEQRFENIGWADKFESLQSALKSVEGAEGKPAKALVFANTKSTVDNIAWRLRESRIHSAVMHGGINQGQRNRAIEDMKSGRVDVLVATDVAARGLDLPGIDHVINFDLPPNGEDFVHRIGRTGRIGNKGVATSFVGNRESALRDIVRSLKDAQKEDPEATPVPDWLEDMCYASQERSFSRAPRRGGSRW
eukprot:TRINITY_DN262_c0_g1_i3.p1 TRINITY_DN262_c0_g1~~TRINITY_DN262_c0_g1_i3.p1  ORF type:complete len:608 (+),score=119.64 TRINITY_DN262_c0_g1_i3:95-1918(+)